MRKAFFSELEKIAAARSDIYVLTGDLGYGFFDALRAKNPRQFMDMGVAECNMIGVASGLALAGKKVYCYSIIPFLIMRAYEQIRVDVSYHGLDVKLIGTGGGFAYGFEGFTHFGLEDFALMKSMPDMTVLAPADSVEARIVARLTAEIKGPMYVRMGKTGEPMLHDEKNPPDFQIGKGIILSEGSDVAVVAAGAMVNESKKAAETLRAKGVSVTLVDMHTIRPLDTALVEQLAASHKAVVTVEDHYVSGGLGSSVAEVLAGKNYPSKFRRFGVQNRREIIVGNAEHLKKAHGLSAEGIASKILNIVKEL